jgi:hypothetical protein
MAREDRINIGKFRDVSLAAAIEWIDSYTNGTKNRTSKNPYAYPAYDLFDADQNQPATLRDGDLLAPTLLNVSVTIRSFYALQARRERLEACLRHEDLARPLAELKNERIHQLIGPLFSVLDDPGGGPWGVGGTTLSKVLHRKRPASIPLHDSWVHACYVGDGAPLQADKSRSWAEYMSELAVAMATDLRENSQQFSLLQESSRAAPRLTDLRLLDILAWNLGRRGGDHSGGASTNRA